MLLPWILCIVLLIAFLIEIIKNIQIRKSLDEIRSDFERCLSEETNVQIAVSSADEAVRSLAKAINLQLTQLRKMQLKYVTGNNELVDAVTNISHDLRTPLTAIWGYLDLLEKKELPPDEKRYVEQIRNRCEVLKQLTEELFRYSVISSTSELSYENINLCKVLEETLLSFENTMQEAGMMPDIQIPSAPVWRRVDASALTRIFSNIINNAVKYSDGDFMVVLDESGNISFSNTAKELSTVEVGKLFDRFYTVDSARKSTGLGLSIAKLLTEQMNGSVQADYEDNRLTITVRFDETVNSNSGLC